MTSMGRLPIARICYFVDEEGDQRGWYGFDVYTEDALARQQQRLALDHEVRVEFAPIEAT